MKTMVFILLFLNIVWANSPASFTSSSNKVNIIELYTSQGCSSCPVADDWLNELTHDENLFKTFIPLAFHVNYWDFIGWKDVFAQEKFTDRQRNYSSIWNLRSVYTPQFIVNAKEYRQWFRNKAFPIFTPKNNVGKLTAFVNNNTLSIDFENLEQFKGHGKVNVAILGFDYVINVNKGENKGRKLKHNFVVEYFDQHSVQFIKQALKKDVALPSYTKDRKRALVVFLTKEKSNEIIQAVGGYL